MFFMHTGQVLSVENPLTVPNNKVGIHILNESDLEDAARLVNSSGGEWGYVTIVIRKDERNIGKWQRTFDKMRRLKLIPIVRIASTMESDYWSKLQENDIDSWVYFLNSLNWVIKNRYVVIGNEPNHAKEWGGELNPEEYAHYLSSFTKKLKDSSPEFFILPSGFDASAPNAKETMSEDVYLKRMIDSVPDLFNNIDGWVSHSYPNPNFSGSENDSGRGTIKTYEWEKDYLKSIGIDKNLPVFITETGWLHNMDGKISFYHTPFSVGQRLIKAYENVWNTPEVVAVTPFILNYASPPFENFSWKKSDGSFYEHYVEIQKLGKVYGNPLQKVSGEIITVIVPQVIKRGESFYGMAYVKNTGQAIWDGGVTTVIGNSDKNIEIEPVAALNLEPGQKGFAFFKGSFNEEVTGSYSSDIKLILQEKEISIPHNIFLEIIDPEEGQLATK